MARWSCAIAITPTARRMILPLSAIRREGFSGLCPIRKGTALAGRIPAGRARALRRKATACKFSATELSMPGSICNYESRITSHEPREYCGLFGISGHKQASWLTYLGLFAQQHRGQEACGIAVNNKGVLS